MKIRLVAGITLVSAIALGLLGCGKGDDASTSANDGRPDASTIKANSNAAPSTGTSSTGSTQPNKQAVDPSSVPGQPKKKSH